MAKVLMAGLISLMASGAFAQAIPGHPSIADDNYKASHGQRNHRHHHRGGNWICYADNLIVKGFIGESADKATAMEEAMARCESSSQLPCFKVECRQN